MTINSVYIINRMYITDLPHDVIEEIYIHLFRSNRLSDIGNFGRTCKYLHECFLEVIQNQCKKDYNIHKWFHDSRTIQGLVDLAQNENRADIVKWINSCKKVKIRVRSHCRKRRQPKFRDIVKWGYKKKETTKWFSVHYIRDITEKAASEGQLNYLKWQYKNSGEISKNVLLISSYYGYIDIVKWTHEKNLLHDEDISVIKAMDGAAENNKIHVLKWLHENGYKCTVWAMDLAANHGYIEILKWLHENRSEKCSFMAMIFAIRNGHFHCIEWLHKEQTAFINVPYLYDDYMNEAILRGHLNIVQFLYENYYYSNIEEYIEYAKKLNKTEIFSWLLSQGKRTKMISDE